MMCAKSEVKRGTRWTVWVPELPPDMTMSWKTSHGAHFTFSHQQTKYFESSHLNQTWWEHNASSHTVVSISQYLRSCSGPQTVQLYQVWCLNEQWTWWPSPHIHNHCTMWLTVWGKLLRNCNKLLYLLLHYIVMMIPITCYQKYLVMETVI